MAPSLKHVAYGELARIGKALANPIRLELLDLLGQAPRSVEQLARAVGQSKANTSQHLQVLLRAKLVRARKQGLFVHYRVADDDVAQFFVALRRLGEGRLAELEHATRTLTDARASELESIDRGTLVSRMQTGEVTLIDVRPRHEFEAGHIAGARSLPLDELEQRLDELPTAGKVVAYCRGPYCVMALDAVELLRARGFEALRFEEGVVEWRGEGLPVASEGVVP
jgi:rhodanese-related sulfurtransferase/DNA-binding transcriptional ArsR family regulator